jgi:biopolymer transport protein ExbD
MKNKVPIHLKPLPEPRLEILNLIDILITLVAFFMLTSTFVVEQSHQARTSDLGINLPQVRHSGRADKSDERMVLELNKNHQIFYRGEPISQVQLKELFQKQAVDTVIAIKADRDCRYSWVVDLLDLAAGCKLNKIALEVRK